MDQLVRVFKALADPTRARIVAELADGGLCVGALAHRLGVTHSAVSQHLRILREAGLVGGERQGYRVHYSLDRDRIHEVSAQVARWMECLGTIPAKPRSKTAEQKTRQSKGKH